MADSKGWIGVDLDGTLAMFEGGRVDAPLGAPIELMVSRVRAWLAEGRDVRIFTARAARTDESTYHGYYDNTGDTFHAKQEQMITEWCIEHLGCALPITATKDFMMAELWDDRAVAVMTNTGMSMADWLDAQEESL